MHDHAMSERNRTEYEARQAQDGLARALELVDKLKKRIVELETELRLTKMGAAIDSQARRTIDHDESYRNQPGRHSGGVPSPGWSGPAAHLPTQCWD